MGRFIHSKPSRTLIDSTVKLNAADTEREIAKLQRQLGRLINASACHHENLDTFTVEDCDGHRTDYTTYWRCLSCGWSQYGKWFDPIETTHDNQ